MCSTFGISTQRAIYGDVVNGGDCSNLAAEVVSVVMLLVASASCSTERAFERTTQITEVCAAVDCKLAIALGERVTVQGDRGG